MNITYHLELTPYQDNLAEIPHSMLAEEIQQFIISKGEKQEFYKARKSGEYIFIYTEKGNRFDVKY